VKAQIGGNISEFFTMHDYHASNVPSNAKISYYKGLGSSTREEARNYFTRLCELKRLISHTTDEDTQSMKQMFMKKHTEERKRMILEHLQSPCILPISRTISTDAFVKSELLYFSAYDVARSIPSVIDGLKISQRKVVHVSRHLKKVKVAQLASTVALKTVYLHGENSLADCITGMAQSFVGSNNHPLLDGIGQFGSRLLGGKDAASPRYTHVQPSTFLKNTFLMEDDPLLDLLEEENEVIEPRFFVPIVPVVLINGSRGIATGYSSYVPNYSLADVIEATYAYLDDREPVDLEPHFEKFDGVISKLSESKYNTFGIYKTTKKCFEITELPLLTWTEPFLQKIQQMKEVSKVTSRCDDVSVSIEVKMESVSLLKKLLTTTLSTSNMYLLNENSELQKFKSPNEILVYFVNFRMKYYTKRKEWILQKLTQDEEHLKQFIKFIALIQADGIQSFMNDSHAFLDEHDLPHSLLSTSVSEITAANLKKQQLKLDTLLVRIDEQKSLSEKEMYKTDLEKLKKAMSCKSK